MAGNPFEAPQARVADQPIIVLASRPKQVTLAVALLWVSFALSFPMAYLLTSRAPELRAHPTFLAFGALVFVVSAVLNVLVYRGHNWARVISVVLIAVGIFGSLLPTNGDSTAGSLENALEFIEFALELAAIYLLITKPGALWFKNQR